jgi:hypothetical protein
MEIAFSENNTRVGNPNPETPYVMVRDSIQAPVDPLQVFLLPRLIATQMIAKAEKNFSEQKMQAEEERKLFSHAEESQDPRMRDRAKNYAKRVDGVIVTNTQPPKFPFLVDLGTEEGLRMYKEGVAIAKEKGLKIPVFEEGEFAKNLTSSVDRGTVKTLRAPKEDWTREEMKDYVKNNGGVLSNADKEFQLLKKCKALFNAIKKRYEEDGFEVVLK